MCSVSVGKKMNSVKTLKKPSFLRPNRRVIERVQFFSIPFDPQLRADTYNSILFHLPRVSLLNGVVILPCVQPQPLN